MARITFITHEGERHEVDATTGESVMEAAIANGVPGIDADCGGSCACGTCHVFVTTDWIERTGKASEMESDMLEFAENVQPNSRLSCQIEVRDAHDGMIIELPESQH